MTATRPDKLDTVLAERERIKRSGGLHWMHWLIIIASLVLTYLAWTFARNQVAAQTQTRFDREATQAVALVSERMQKYEDALWSGVAAVRAGQVDNTAAVWRTYTQELQLETKYPGVNGIGIIDYVRRENLEAYLAKERALRPDFRIHPPHARSDLFPIVYVEPVARNKAAVGLDIAHEANRYSAAIKARDTGLSQITGPIQLVQDAQKTPGFLFYAPFYKGETPEGLNGRADSFSGMVYAPFTFNILMSGTLDSDNRHVGLKVLDKGEVLFDENQPGAVDYDPKAEYITTHTIDMHGRKWDFEIRSQQSFRDAAANTKPTFILLGGILIDSLLLGVFTLLARSNRRALKFADKMADAQKADAARLRNIIDNTVNGLMTVDDNGRISSFNKACEAILNMSADEIIGHDITYIIPNWQTLLGSILVSLSDERSTHEDISKSEEIEVIWEDGHIRILDIAISEVFIRERRLYSVIIRDITRRKQADAALNRAIEDLRLSNEDLEKFAYIASHDLKSPLRAIDNLSQWLEEDLDAVIDDENRDRVHKLRGRVLRMENLLDALLAYSRAGNKIVDTKKVFASDLIQDIKETLNVPGGFKLVIDDSLKNIEVARMPLEQIFHNLINNAFKHHNKETGVVTVYGKVLEGQFRFSVADDGPGIDPKFHGKIFEMFQTLRPRDEVEGSGMGLALVKKIVHRFGGRIEVQSSEGNGSVFTFTWPQVQRKSSRQAVL